MFRTFSTLIFVLYSVTCSASSYSFKLYEDAEEVPFKFEVIKDFQVESSARQYDDGLKEEKKRDVAARVDKHVDLLVKRQAKLALVRDDKGTLVGASWITQYVPDCLYANQTNTDLPAVYKLIFESLFQSSADVKAICFKMTADRVAVLKGLLKLAGAQETEPYKHDDAGDNWQYFKINRPLVVDMATCTFTTYDSPEGIDVKAMTDFQVATSLALCQTEAMRELVKVYVPNRIKQNLTLVEAGQAKLALIRNAQEALLGVACITQPTPDCIDLRQSSTAVRQAYGYIMAKWFEACPEAEYIRFKIPEENVAAFQPMLEEFKVVRTDPYLHDDVDTIKWAFYRLNRPAKAE
jgi:hypothetical protein